MTILIFFLWFQLFPLILATARALPGTSRLCPLTIWSVSRRSWRWWPKSRRPMQRRRSFWDVSLLIFKMNEKKNQQTLNLKIYLMGKWLFDLSTDFLPDLWVFCQNNYSLSLPLFFDIHIMVVNTDKKWYNLEVEAILGKWKFFSKFSKIY